MSHFQVLALWKHQVKFGKASRHLRTFRFGVFQYLTWLLNITGTLEWDKSIPAWGICNGWFFSPMSLANQPILNQVWIITLGLLCPLLTHAAAWRISPQDFHFLAIFQKHLPRESSTLLTPSQRLLPKVPSDMMAYLDTLSFSSPSPPFQNTLLPYTSSESGEVKWGKISKVNQLILEISVHLSLSVFLLPMTHWNDLQRSLTWNVKRHCLRRKDLIGSGRMTKRRHQATEESFQV